MTSVLVAPNPILDSLFTFSMNQESNEEEKPPTRLSLPSTTALSSAAAAARSSPRQSDEIKPTREGEVKMGQQKEDAGSKKPSSSNNKKRKKKVRYELLEKHSLGSIYQPGPFYVICAKGNEAREHTGTRTTGASRRD